MLPDYISKLSILLSLFSLWNEALLLCQAQLNEHVLKTGDALWFLPHKPGGELLGIFRILLDPFRTVRL